MQDFKRGGGWNVQALFISLSLTEFIKTSFHFCLFDFFVAM